MAEVLLYVLYLAVLLLLAPLAHWRWGLKASLPVAVAGLGLVLLVLYSLAVFQLLPPPPPRRPLLPDEYGVLERMRQDHAEGFAHALAIVVGWVVIPALAVLTGCAVSLVWAAVAAIRRSFADRPNATPRT